MCVKGVVLLLFVEMCVSLCISRGVFLLFVAFLSVDVSEDSLELLILLLLPLYD